jgi:transposase-like protein
MSNQPVRHEMDLMELMLQFGSDDKCRKYLEALRFPNGVYCIKCQSDKISRIAKRNQFACDACKYQFSATAGTIFHDSHLPLQKWFAAVYLMCESRKGISANQMKRTLKVAYKTAWYLCHRIREALKSTDIKMSGTVEIDETYVGGKFKNMHGEALNRAKARPNKGKLVTVGALQRNGEIRLKHVPNSTSEMLMAFAATLVNRKTERVFTDESSAYANLETSLKVDHTTVNHSEGQYVRNGFIHTNGIENVFSLFKRSIVGSFHHISEKHIDKYLDEFEHRFNNRDNPYLFRDTLLRLINSEKIEYKDLVKKS